MKLFALALLIGGIDPSQDANRAKFTEPAVLIWQECGLGDCSLVSQYIWVPSISEGKPIVCFRAEGDRLAQCFYRDKDGTTIMIPILPRGERT